MTFSVVVNRITRSCEVEQQQMVVSILSFPQSTMKFIECAVQVQVDQQGGWRREAWIQDKNVANFLSKHATSYLGSSLFIETFLGFFR
jgi:hypothetical protein